MTMAKTKNVFALEMEKATLKGVLELLYEWRNKDTNKLHPGKWMAIVIHFRHSQVEHMFCEEAGVTDHMISNWYQGLLLPSPDMCAHYSNLLIQKIQEYQDTLTKRCEQLRTAAKAKKEERRKYTLPEEKILRFLFPHDMDIEFPLEEMDGYRSLPERIRNCLTSENIVDAGDVLLPNITKTWQVFFKTVPNFGKVSMGRLYYFLVENGFTPVFDG